MKPKERPLASLGKIMCYEPQATKANTMGVPNKTDMEQARDPHSHSGAWCNENHQFEKTLVPPASQQPHYNSQRQETNIQGPKVVQEDVVQS